jgi:hypothetical protein
MPVVSRTVDTLVSLDEQLQAAVDFEAAFPLYLAKRRLVEELQLMDQELRRLSHGWVWREPVVAPVVRRCPVTAFEATAHS